MTSPITRRPGHPGEHGGLDTAGRAAARRSLWLSIPALALAFAVWMLWSVVVVHLGAAGFRFSTPQLFWLAALPALSGASLRIVYTLAAPLTGGRRFTTLATASLLLPALGIGLAVQDPTTSFEWMVLLALLCGLGGGNFASSMAHLGRSVPTGHQRWALGLNAALGHLGVAAVQLLVPLAIGVGLFGALGGLAQATPQGPMWLQNAGFVWVPLVLASTAAAWFGMDDPADAPLGLAEQVVLLTRRHTWLMCWLFLGSVGSFIGLAASGPLLVQSQFQRPEALTLVGLGPLVGAALWPLGGWLADRRGGGSVTCWVFTAMATAATAALLCLPGADAGGRLGPGGQVAGFLLALGVLFAAAGLGSGSSFQMVSSLFVSERLRQVGALPSDRAQAVRDGRVDAVTALGFTSAIGAYGGFFLPKLLGTSLALTGSPATGLQLAILFYLSCAALTWWACCRRNAPHPC